MGERDATPFERGFFYGLRAGFDVSAEIVRQKWPAQWPERVAQHLTRHIEAEAERVSERLTCPFCRPTPPEED